jgi:hypothetical protein
MLVNLLRGGQKAFSYPSSVPYVAIQFLTQTNHPWMVVGPVFSSEAVTSVLQVGHITSIGPSAVASVNRATFPFQASSDVIVSRQGPLIAALCAKLAWKKVRQYQYPHWGTQFCLAVSVVSYPHWLCITLFYC